MSTEKKKFLLFKQKPVEVLLSLREGPKYAATVSKETDCTYSHTVKLLKLFDELGLLNSEKKGRIKLVKLTAPGYAIANAIYSILMKLSKTKGE